MELIYMDNSFREMGIIKDFTIDYAYGKDENDFEITTPELEMEQGYYWYIPDTEYGGKVDEIEFQNKVSDGIYRGRTWSGILNSFSGIQLDTNFIDEENDVDFSVRGTGDYLLQLTGSPKNILQRILVDDLGLNLTIMEDSYDEDTVVGTVNAVQGLYNMLVEFFSQFEMKIVFNYDNGLQVGVVSANDFSEGQYFDNSVYTLTAKSNTKLPNHLIGTYNNGKQIFVKHIYIDENGEVQPYYEIDPSRPANAPVNDYEYYRATGTKQVSGMNEVVELIEGGSTVENYDVVMELKNVDSTHPVGTTGNTKFANGVPYDWNERCYDKYFYYDKANDKYVNFEMKYDFSVASTSSLSDDKWERTFGNYYKRTQQIDPDTGDWKYAQLTESDMTETFTPHRIPDTQRPKYWYSKDSKKNYSNYYYRYRDGGGNIQYDSVQGITKYRYDKSEKKPTFWSTEKGNYYLYWWWNKYKWKVEFQIKIGGKWVSHQIGRVIKFKGNKNLDKISDSKFWVIDDLEECKFTQEFYTYVKNKGTGKKSRQVVKNSTNLADEIKTQNFSKPKYVKVGNFSRFKVYPKTRYQHQKMHTNLSEYCSITGKKIKDIKWEKNKFALQIQYTVAPSWRKNRQGDGSGYYEMVSNGKVPPSKNGTWYKRDDHLKPAYIPDGTFVKVEDNFTNLCEKMLEKYEELKKSSSSIEPKIDADVMEFDIGDIIGGDHPITKEAIRSKVSKKIMKGNSFKLEVSYEIG